MIATTVRGAITRLAGLALLATVAGCIGASPSLQPEQSASGDRPAATWPVTPEALAVATSGLSRDTLTCGGARTFPTAALNAPGGAEREPGPEFDALRATIAQFGDGFPGAALTGWRLVARDAAGATFVAPAGLAGAPGWLAAEVVQESGGWKPSSLGACDPRVVLSPEFGPATWDVDHSAPAPDASTTQLHLLVWERACSSGSPTTGRMSAALVDEAATSVTITIGVRGLAGVQTCPGPPGTPVIVTLPRPLGGRLLLDGGREPPATPSPGP
jgi:hypothetical protein